MRTAIAFLVLAHVALVLSQRYEYQVPRPSIYPINPRGFRMSIRDRQGIEKVTFHANIDKQLSDTDPGEFSEVVSRPWNGRWSFQQNTKQINSGDTIYFRVHVIRDGIEYRYDNGRYFVTEKSFSSEESNESNSWSSEERYRH